VRQPRPVLVATAVSGLLLAVFAGKVAASSAAFSFTMEKRAVWGNRNKKLHALDAGELNLSGGVWVVSKNRGSSAAPDVVTIEVHKGQEEDKVCSASVVPSTQFNEKRTFDKSCGRIEAGNYWVFLSRPNEAGWHLKGSGALVTK
jgi:hypothetical protein